MGAAARAVLLAIVQALGERYASEEAATRSGGPVSVGFLLWFQPAVRLPVLMKSELGLDAISAGPGFPTCRAIAMLFEGPARVPGTEAAAFEAFFAGGARVKDRRCDYLLANAGLPDRLAEEMIDGLDYDADIVAYRKAHDGRRNSAPAAGRDRLLCALRADGRLAAMREAEWVYEICLLPLAGTWFPVQAMPARSVRAGGVSPRSAYGPGAAR